MMIQSFLLFFSTGPDSCFWEFHPSSVTLAIFDFFFLIFCESLAPMIFFLHHVLSADEQPSSPEAELEDVALMQAYEFEVEHIVSIHSVGNALRCWGNQAKLYSTTIV